MTVRGGGVAALVCVVVLAAGGQSPVPARPALSAGQDTNSAESYVSFGMLQIPDHPKLAADAFYWATRIDPANGAGWYGRWAAHLLDPDTPPAGSITTPGGFTVANPTLEDPDSLRSKALLREPLLYVRLDFVVADELMRRQSRGRMTLYQTDDPTLRAEIDYSIGRFGEATRELEEAIHAHGGYHSLHIERARAFRMQSQWDSAIHEVGLYLALPDRTIPGQVAPDYTDLMVQYALARLQETKRDWPSAKTTYGKLLGLDSTFAGAHAGLARIALAEQDVPTALAELAKATVRADAPTCYAYGLLLIRVHDPAGAATQLGRAIASDSDYIPPYYPLAVIEEAAGFDSEAVAHYRRFIAGAPRTLVLNVDTARARLERLQVPAAKPN